MRLGASITLFVCILTALAQSTAAQEFHTINGPLGAFGVFGVSPPANVGAKVAGATPTSNGIGPALWFEETGLVPLRPDLTRYNYGGYGSAVAEDGSYFAGYLEFAPGNDPSDVQRKFFLWSEAKGYEELSQPNDVFGFRPQGVSNGGEVVVGKIDRVGGTGIGIWNAGSGFTSLVTPTDATYAVALSGDGKSMAAQTYDPLGNEAFRWTEATGFVGLSDAVPSLTEPSSAHAITGNALLGMVGDSPFIWTGAQVEVLPVDIPGTIKSMGADPADPTNSLTVLTQIGDEPTLIWTAAGGLRSLEHYLEVELGLTTGLAATYGRVLSSNGRNILGSGPNSAGMNVDWIVTVPEPSTMLLIATAGACLAIHRVRRTRV